MQIRGYNLRHLDFDVGVSLQESPQIEGRIVRRKDSGRDLVEQWLKLVVVILINHGYFEISVGRQSLGACQSSETRTNDYHALCSDLVNLHSRIFHRYLTAKNFH
jgi:hypothetical protein